MPRRLHPDPEGVLTFGASDRREASCQANHIVQHSMRSMAQLRAASGRIDEMKYQVSAIRSPPLQYDRPAVHRRVLIEA